MSNTIYTNLDIEEIKSKIDISRLKRDYSKEPLKTTKNGIGSEFLTKEELEYLYIELNLTREQISIFLGCTFNKVLRMIENLKVHKSMELRMETVQATNLKKYGTKHYIASEQCRNKSNKTCMERYGVKNIMTNKVFREKAKQTKLEKYGDENYNNREKFKHTKFERYGDENYVNPLKGKQTKLEKYGDENYNNIEQIKATKLERYDDEYYSNREKSRQTKLERYGDEYYSNLPKCQFTNLEKYGNVCSLHGTTIKGLEVQTKCRNTLMNHYGVDSIFKSKEVQEKSKQTMIERHGVETYFIAKDFQQKAAETKKKNNSFNTSKPEEKIFKLLLSKFKQVNRQYKSELYPWKCDFYIPDLDLYIEYQGYEGHGVEPYNSENPDHIQLVEKWKQKAEETNYKGKKKGRYLGYINIWTQRDPLKRKIAQDNHLNWVEFFNYEQFMEWFSKLG